MIIDVFGWLLAFLFTIFYHELGHYVKAKDLGYKAEYVFPSSILVHGEVKDADDRGIALAGVMCGFVPVLGYLAWSLSAVGVFLLVGLYLFGVRKDLMIVLALHKYNNVKEKRGKGL